ncbi:PAS domain-containing protein, partial [Ideonella sp.]|uniref:PAS domain-containing protein n=1 Tax=Ideonella sp. TaxID=1929293 RepID=UPI002B4656FA
MRDVLLRSIGAALDGLDVGFCAFDSRDRTLAWNRSFLDFFPEHRGHVHKGEPYADNLRRFYATRLDEQEAPLIERYVAEGIARHHAQRRPYEFEHLGARLRVASAEFGALGRVRVWRRVASATGVASHVRPPQPAELAGIARLFLESHPDGALLVDSGDRVHWANESFLQMYGLDCADEALGVPFEALYRRAWRSTPHAEEFLRSLEVLRENQRFAGAPFEIELPGERWVRVVEQRGEAVDGRALFVHQDISLQRSLQRALDAAEERARRCEAQPTAGTLRAGS